MKYFFLYIILLFCFIVSMAYYNTFININSKEPFTNKIKNKKEKNKEKEIIILLGDSILKNNYYAKNNESIEEFLYKKNKNTYCYAADDSLIEDISSQVNAIPEYLNTKNTFIFLSIGGNNILNYREEDDSKHKHNINLLQSIFSSYKKLIKQIQQKINKSNIILLDIYYPKSEKYKKFHSIIAEWNNMIYNYANNPNNNIYEVLKISNIIVEDDDFSHQIEPSTKGGEKIASAIIKTQ